MSRAFRDLLKTIGSGQHTRRDLTRSEAKAATRMMLLGEATPTQIGGFLIAHRIKRPTGEEMAGMLDAYEELGPSLPALDLACPLTIFGHPYDGRSRTAPIAPLIALLLAAAGLPVLLHGSGSCPTKYGLPLVEIWQGLGVNWRGLSLSQVSTLLSKTGVGFLYLPDHFPLAQQLMSHRDEIGKRPPLATLELIWTPYQGPCHLIFGYVHPPTESIALEAFQLRGLQVFTAVKGLEGSCDLPRERTAILNQSFERRLLKAVEYGLGGSEVPLEGLDPLISQMQGLLTGQLPVLHASVIWSSGYYLHRLGKAPTVSAGLEQADRLLSSGAVLAKLNHLQTELAALSTSVPFVSL